MFWFKRKPKPPSRDEAPDIGMSGKDIEVGPPPNTRRQVLRNLHRCRRLLLRRRKGVGNADQDAGYVREIQHLRRQLQAANITPPETVEAIDEALREMRG